MNRVSVLHNQNVADIAIEKQGDIRSVFEIALNNDLSVTDTLVSGLVMVIPDTQYKNIDITTYYARRNQKIATDNLPGVDQYIFSQTLPFIL